MTDSPIIMEEVTDPAVIARTHAQHERAERNDEWLQTHWGDVFPQARGKFLAVAGQEAFIADTFEEAWTKARAAHPDDDGALCQYVFPSRGPRIYAHHWAMARGGRRHNESGDRPGINEGRASGIMIDSPIIMEEVTDPAVIARALAQHERAKRNSDWLEAHWPDLLPQARGKHLAVAGQEAFIADTPEEAWAMAKTAHPDDNGALPVCFP